MASLAVIESHLNTLPKDMRVPLKAAFQEICKQIRFGAPDEDAAPAENFAGHLIPWTTSGTPDQEVAIPHALGRTPRLILTGLIPTDVVNASAVQVTQTQVADATYVYLSSPEPSISTLVYVE